MLKLLVEAGATRSLTFRFDRNGLPAWFEWRIFQCLLVLNNGFCKVAHESDVLYWLSCATEFDLFFIIQQSILSSIILARPNDNVSVLFEYGPVWKLWNELTTPKLTRLICLAPPISEPPRHNWMHTPFIHVSLWTASKSTFVDLSNHDQTFCLSMQSMVELLLVMIQSKSMKQRGVR